MSEVLAAVPAAPAWRFARGSLPRCAVAAAALTGLADWLFYGHDIGISAALWLVFAGLAFCWCSPAALSSGRVRRAALVLAAAALPWLVNAGWIQSGLSLAGCALASAILTSSPGADVFSLAGRAILRMGWRILPDMAAGAMAVRAARQGKWSPADALIWLVPAGLGLVFLALFAAANPVIAAAVSAINPAALLAFTGSARFWFWLVFAACLWPFLRPPAGAVTSRAKPDIARPDGIWSVLAGRAAVLRSLVVFNLLFAVQSAMDIDYLWLGRRLPRGTDYAAYAHQGAYPLIFTACLAGAFSIIATRPGSPAGASKPVKWLVLAWILQNMLLVFSSILRLKLYVDAYELTLLRVAALIWMVVVAAGLVTILVRIALHLSNRWLVRANLFTLAATLYVCSFTDFGHVVAMYDVTHCLEVSGRGQPLDIEYVTSLGPQAIPALDLYQVRTTTAAPGQPFAFLSSGDIGSRRDDLVEMVETDDTGWRGWNIWTWYLHRYLRTHQPAG